MCRSGRAVILERMSSEQVTGELADFLAAASSDEPLHPDLVPYLEHHTSLGTVLRHPLVIDVALRPGLANRAYRLKQQYLAEATREQDWSRYVWLHERPYRLDAFVNVADELDDAQYWSLLAHIWVDSENIWQNLALWQLSLRCDRPAREHFMDETERRDFDALPEVLTVYRGCSALVNEQGLSWTLEADRAVWFAQRFGPASPLVLTGQVAKCDVVGRLDGRGEQEIVVADADLVDVVDEQPLAGRTRPRLPSS